MALHIRDDRAAQLARRLAQLKGTTMTQAVVSALERALATQERPFEERVADIVREAQRLSDPKKARPVDKQEIDDLWGHE